jgi:hypothetical protein
MEQKLEDAQLRLEEARREAARASSALERAEVVAWNPRVGARETAGRVTELEAAIGDLTTG